MAYLVPVISEDLTEQFNHLQGSLQVVVRFRSLPHLILDYFPECHVYPLMHRDQGQKQCGGR